MVVAGTERFGEDVAHGSSRRAAHAVDEARPSLDEEGVAHLVENADGLEHPDARGQQRLAEVKAGMVRAFEQDHAAPERGEPRREYLPRRGRRR